ncbi:Uncharacterised protein [Mycobacteroides abscessus]|nr:Uncharacterised protein [Mycobacteroides abscessus]
MATSPSGSWPSSPPAYMWLPKTAPSIVPEGLHSRVSTESGHRVLHHMSRAE